MDDKVLMYGLRGRYFFGHRPDRNSPYVLAGVVVANISGEAYFQDEYAGTKTSTASANTTSTGAVIGGGYQWTFGSLFGGTRSSLNVGGFYGDGYSVSTSAQSSDGQTTQINSLRAEYGPMIEAAYGIMF